MGKYRRHPTRHLVYKPPPRKLASLSDIPVYPNIARWVEEPPPELVLSPTKLLVLHREKATTYKAVQKCSSCGRKTLFIFEGTNVKYSVCGNPDCVRYGELEPA